MLPGPAVPGCCLTPFHFRWAPCTIFMISSRCWLFCCVQHWINLDNGNSWWEVETNWWHTILFRGFKFSVSCMWMFLYLGSNIKKVWDNLLEKWVLNSCFARLQSNHIIGDMDNSRLQDHDASFIWNTDTCPTSSALCPRVSKMATLNKAAGKC